MIHIKNLFLEILNISDISQLSIIRISTSNPVYLVFNNSDYPVYVAKEIDQENGVKLFEVNKILYENLSDLIAKPIKLVKKSNKYYYIEEGLKGIPWFQLNKTINTLDGWTSIRELALNSLASFQYATKNNYHWHKNINPIQELWAVLNQCNIDDQELENKLFTKIKEYSSLLEGLGEIEFFNQHGDFCLNNLLFTSADAKIIDLEDFGATSFPLFDEFTLALSFYRQTPSHLRIPMKQELSICFHHNIEQKLIGEEYLPCFFLYHLLFRIGKWSDNSKRYEFRKWLISILRDFIKSPDRYF